MTTQIFISHSSKDKAIAEGILNYLRSLGYPDERLFLDSDSRSGLLPGLQWQPGLFKSLKDCACLIVVGTQNWENSRWCFAEALIAKNLDRKIVSLLIASETTPAIISEYQSIRNFSPEDDQKLTELVTSLKRLHLSPPVGNQVDKGWILTSPDAERWAEIGSIVDKALPWWWRATQKMVVATFVLVVFSIAALGAYVFKDDIDHWLHPPETVNVSADEFLKKVSERNERKSILGKKVALLRGKPVADFSASKPRIDIGPNTRININHMYRDESIPESLPDTVTFSCVVQSINQLTIRDKTQFTVYVTDFKSLTSDAP